MTSPVAATTSAPAASRLSTGFRPDIQGLRAVAVMLVLLSHAGFGWFGGGYIGVDVFFVVSGFLITSLLAQEATSTGSISISGFYARRARRILPAATVVTVATAVASWLWFPITRFTSVMHDALAVVTYVVNYRFVIENSEYMNAGALPSPFQQYWSLAVEEQFYLVWPLSLLLLVLVARRRPDLVPRLATVVVAVIFVASLTASIVITAQAQTTAYFATHTRAWELAGGALLALTLPTWRRLPRSVALACGAVGLLLVVGASVVYDRSTAFPGSAALTPVLGTMLLITAGTAYAANPATALLSTRPFQYVGDISYSLYLWHWPFLVLGPIALDLDPSRTLSVLLLGCAFAAAHLSYTLVETPFRTGPRIRRRHRNGLAAGAVCSVIAAATVLILMTALSKAPGGERETDLTAVDVAPSLTSLTQQLRDGLSVDEVPDDLEPALATVDHDLPTPYTDHCHLDFVQTGARDACAYGDTRSDTTVVLYGDSHAAQWFPALDALAKQHGWRLLSRTKSSCPPVLVPIGSTQHAGEYKECAAWQSNVLAEIDDLRPALVVVSAADDEKLLDATGSGASTWARGWTSTVERLADSAGRVVSLTDTPRATAGRSADCLALHQHDVAACLRDASYELTALDRRRAAAAAQEAAGATVIDTEAWFCINGRCPPIVDDLLVFRDQHHISTPYATYLSGILGDILVRR